MENIISPKYKSLLESLISNHITKPKPKGLSEEQAELFIRANERRIAFLTSLYVSHLSSIGYSKSYIRYSVEKQFFKDPVSRLRISRLKTFFDRFDGSLSNFRVFVLVNQQARDYLVGTSVAQDVSRPDVKDDTLSVIDSVRVNYTETPIVVMMRQKALDFFTAGHQSIARIRSYQSAAFLGSWLVDLEITEEVIVSTRGYGSTESFKVGHGDIAAARKVHALPKAAINGAIKASERVFDKVNNHADQVSRDRLVNALITAHSAASTQSAESQLISLWSAFEALLSPPPLGSSSRIGHYSRLILPAVCAHYPMRNCIYVSNILMNHNREPYKILSEKIMKDGKVFTDRFHYLITALSLPQYRVAYEDLISSCASNRLLVNLLRSLKERFSDPRLFIETLNSHEQKANWQISRMYRARNQIVHAGIAPNFSDSVVVNAFEYLSTTMGAITAYLNKDSERSCIDNVMELVAMNYYSSKEDIKKLSGKNSFDESNVFKAFRSVA